MKILLIGSIGLLGTDIVDNLEGSHDLYALNVEGVDPRLSANRSFKGDITDQGAIFNGITKINPDLVINTSAYSDVDGCERDPDLACRVNALGVRNIAVACQRFDTALCHISTDYVFSGNDTPKDGYSEYDAVNPLSVYGKTKNTGEFFARQLLNKFYILRVALLFGKKRKNFTTMVVDSILEGKKIKVVKDQYGSPTYTKDVASAISELVEKPLYGIYHFVNAGGCSRQEYVEEIFRIMGRKPEYELIDPAGLFFAPRPRDSRLNNTMWARENFRLFRSWKDALKEFVLEYSANKKAGG